MARLLYKIVVLKLLFISLTISIYAQELSVRDFSNEQLGGVYYAYPVPIRAQTPAPKGYVPFYISHYGRHGSRWITSDERYTKVLDVFEIQELTPLGEDVKQRLYKVWEDARGRSGHLTSLGERQHKEIAQRMYRNYPEVFSENSVISARSSTSIRCIMSMSAFSERLKELRPDLQITREANERYMNYIAYTSPEAKQFLSEESDWRKDYNRFVLKHVNPRRLISSLFKYPDQIAEPHALMDGLYWIAADMQNVDLSSSFYDIFEKQELFDIWQCVNYRMYVCNAAAPINGGIMPRSAISLLKNIIESADEAINNQISGATLRFGHDTNLIRLLTLMQIEGCNNKETNPNLYYQVWQDFEVSPMAGNLQVIFYKNKKGEIIVKFLHNENEVRLPVISDIAPFYYWSDVKELYSDIFHNH